MALRDEMGATQTCRAVVIVSVHVQDFLAIDGEQTRHDASGSAFEG